MRAPQRQQVLDDLRIFGMSWSRPIDVLLREQARRVRVADLLAIEDEGDPVDCGTHGHGSKHPLVPTRERSRSRPLVMIVDAAI